MNEEKKSNAKIFISILAVLICMISSVAYIVFKLTSNRRYEEQWEEYEDCGIQ